MVTRPIADRFNISITGRMDGGVNYFLSLILQNKLETANSCRMRRVGMGYFPVQHDSAIEMFREFSYCIPEILVKMAGCPKLLLKFILEYTAHRF